MIRRFVNVVAQNYESSMYSLHRLDVAKHLFYPSTADAEAAATASENANDGRVGGRKPKPRMFDRLRRLPAPIMRFQPPPTADSSCWSPPAGTFVLLSPRSSDGRILHISADGHALLYDADSCSTCAMPGFDKPERRPIAVTAAGPGNEECEGLYMMTDHQNYHYGFKVLDLRQYPRRWQPLPLPPFAAKYSSHIKSFTVVDGGRTICVSCNEPAVDELELFRVAWPVDLADRTYCFDTASREWRRAGEWALPFDGRAEYHPHHLCSSDLSAIDAMGAPREAPALEHVWEDLSLPPDEKVSIVLNRRFPNIIRTTTKKWCVGNPSLVNLGSGKFCIAKVVLATETVFLSYSYTPDDEPLGEFAVLTGVEVVPDGEGGLRMVKHKSKRYVFTSDEIKWVF
ncbi:hypothetical protein ACP70R_014411 [Stipagrostis hirtigluma subsp. patula]